MFVIAYDMSVADVQVHHPRGPRQAYEDIKSTLNKYGFERVQGSVYVARTEDLASLFSAIDGLRELVWFGRSVKNIRAFRMEQGSDLTSIMKPKPDTADAP